MGEGVGKWEGGKQSFILVIGGQKVLIFIIANAL